MPEETSGSQAGSSNGTPAAVESPGGKPMGALGITLITLYLTLVAVVVFHSLVILWPPLREQPNEEAQEISERLDRIEKFLIPRSEEGGSVAAEGAATAGEATTEPAGTDLTIEDLGSDLAAPIGTDFAGDSGSAAEDEEKKEAQQGGNCAEHPEDEQKQRAAKLFWSFDVCLSDEERLFLIVMFAGALGGLVHTLRSFFWYAGNRKLVSSWTGFYVTLPILGATLATVFYLVVRGGFFSPQSEISDTSPFGFAALAALIGMFTEQAAEKLKQITETLFSEAPKGADHAGPAPAEVKVTTVSPSQGPQAGGTAVTITGSGFAQNATVTFGGQEAQSVQVASDGASITAVTPAAAGLGAVDIEVTNPEGQKGALAAGFTYE